MEVFQPQRFRGGMSDSHGMGVRRYKRMQSGMSGFAV